MHRILIIDDNDEIHSDFRKILEPRETRPESLTRSRAALFGEEPAPPTAQTPRYELESAHQGEAGLECVRRAVDDGKPFAVAFVDMRMPPGWDGLQTIENLWKVDPHLQVVICSAYSDRSWEEITERLGLTDRLLILKKPFDPVEVCQLAAALSEKWLLRGRAALRMEELEKIVAQRTNELTHAAMHDRLTGLPNRANLHQQLEAAFAAHADAGETYTLYFLDFDRFKVVNDSLGHDAGDDLLREIGRRLEECVRHATESHASRATAARLGGDEFVVLLRGAGGADTATRFADEMLAALAEPYQLKGYTISTTASIGVTTSDLGYERPEDALRDADIAMYQAKAAGKDRAVLFDRRMHEMAMRRMNIEQNLRHVLERDEIRLFYQPIFASESGRLKGFEALMRWDDPERGMIQPDEFIGVAEETGAIIELGAWVIREATRQLAAWQRAAPEWPRPLMTVNVSPRQLISRDIVRVVEEAVRESGIDPASLALELTESAVLEDPRHAARLMTELRDLGVQIFLDDFGQGYTSLSHLHRLPLTGIKIDRGFIACISERKEYSAVVHAIAGLAHNLGIIVIAEGVEDSDQIAMLQAMECNYIQGFLLGKPCPAEEATRLLHLPPQRRAA